MLAVQKLGSLSQTRHNSKRIEVFGHEVPRWQYGLVFSATFFVADRHGALGRESILLKRFDIWLRNCFPRTKEARTIRHLLEQGTYETVICQNCGSNGGR